MKFNFIILLINFTYVLTEKCPKEDIFFPCKCSFERHLIFNDVTETAKIECDSSNLTRILNLASEKLENVNQSKHFTIMEVGLLKYELVLNESSFADITFDQFKGYNIKLIHQKAFGKSSQTIKDLEIWGKEVNHSPPEYHVWKMLGSLVNVMQIRIALNITEIPSYAFGKPSNLRKLTIRVSNNFTIRNKAFYHLDHLTHLTLNFHFYAHTGYYERPEIQFQGLEFRESQLGDSQNRKLPQELPYLIKIQNGAFAFEKPSNKKLNIMFIRFKFQGESFEPGSFDGIQRPVELKLQDSSITYLPETMLKSFLNNENNTISFDNSRVNCSDCRNSWLFKENLHENQYDQLKNAECMRESVSNLLDENNKLTLFSFETELYFKSNCNLKFTSKNKSEINYYPCQYHSEKDILRCPSNMTSFQRSVFKSISSQLNRTDNHFRWLIIYKARGLANYFVLDKYSFENIKFDNFAGENIIIKHKNAFGKAVESIKKLIIWNGFFYDHWDNHWDNHWYNHWYRHVYGHTKWRSFWNQFINVQHININLNITEISSNAFNSANLNTLILTTQNKLTIRRNAFYNLENLNELQFNCDFDKIEDEAFAISKRSSKKLIIKFYNINTNAFKTESYKGLERPVNIMLDSFVNYIDFIPESTFKTIFNNQNNITINSNINCTDCNNYWLIRDRRDKQVFGAKCNHNNDLTLFHPQIKCLLSTKCLSHEYFTLSNNENKIHCNQIKSIDYNYSVIPILISIFVPLIAVALLAGGIFYYRKYQLIHINYMTNFIFRRGDDTAAMTSFNNF